MSHLASGGMAEVYLARASGDGGFSRHLVIKAMRPSPGLDGTFARMFLDEARLAAMLHHQHIAQVFDLGTAEDGSYYLAMEYVHGETLRNLLAVARSRSLPVPPGFAVAVGAAVASALQYAHDRCDERGLPLNIIHRDVTPANVLVGHDGAVKLIDFGIAKAAARTSQTLTGVVKGKAGYMAPEQVLNQPLDPRTDVFALGIVLFELTTQERLFAGATDYESAQRCVDAEVPRPSSLRPGYPPTLEKVVLTALARRVEERFPSARAMGQALIEAAARDGLDAHPSIVERVVGAMVGLRREPWQRLPERRADTDVDEEGTTERLPNLGPVDESNAPAAAAAAVAAAVPTMVVPAVVLPPLLSLPLPAPATEARKEPAAEASWLDDSAPEAYELPDRPGSAPRRAVTHPPAPRRSRGAVARWAAGAVAVGIVVGVVASIAAGHDTVLSAEPPQVAAKPAGRAAAGPAGRAAAGPAAALTPAPNPTAVPTPTPTPMPEPTAVPNPTAAPEPTPMPAPTGAPNPTAAPEPTPMPEPTAEPNPTAAPEPTPTAEPTAAPTAAPTPAAEPAAEPEPKLRRAAVAVADSRRIHVSITTTPPDATVVIDGRRLGRTPFEGNILPRGKEVWLKVRKRGHSTRKIKVPVERELTWTVRLPRR